MWSRNLENEEVKARYGAVENKPKWLQRQEKKNNIVTIIILKDYCKTVQFVGIITQLYHNVRFPKEVASKNLFAVKIGPFHSQSFTNDHHYFFIFLWSAFSRVLPSAAQTIRCKVRKFPIWKCCGKFVSHVCCVGLHSSAEGSHLIQYNEYNHNHRDNKYPLTEIQEKLTLLH